MSSHRAALHLWGFMVLLLSGALLWAKSGDAFRRIEFSVRTEAGKTRGIVILPKPARSCPVVVYLHGPGQNWLADGRELRQWAELGLAAVDFDYDQTSLEAFERQFTAVLEHVRQQKWAVADQMAWVGFDLGAQNALRYWLAHPQARPQLLVLLSAGGGMAMTPFANVAEGPRPEGTAPSKAQSVPAAETPELQFQIALVQGERDNLAPPSSARNLAEDLASHGWPVSLKILPAVGHTFDSRHAEVIRVVGEYCKARLVSNHPEPEFTQPHSLPFLWCAFPAFAWLGLGYGVRLRSSQKAAQAPRSKLKLATRVVVGGGLLLALAQVGLHLLLPHLKAGPSTLAIARRYLIRHQWKEDFEVLASQSLWQGQQLRTLLSHLELANYTVRELINWKVEDAVYRNFVLSAAIAADTDRDLAWRRPLWEFYYPRIRKEPTATAAAAMVSCTLREQVTIWPGESSAPIPPRTWPRGIRGTWDKHITDEKGFERLYVAALRSVGVPARLDASGKAEYYEAGQWLAAPRLLLSTWRDLLQPMQVSSPTPSL